MDVCSPTGLQREQLTISYVIVLEESFCYYTVALATLRNVSYSHRQQKL